MSKRLTTETVVAQFKEVHGDTYDYSKVVYVGNREDVTIICKEHGEFQQKPMNHKQNKGCKACAGNVSLTNTDFRKKANKVHNNKYDYRLTTYTGNKNKVIIICPVHGEFEQEAGSHLRGVNCFECGKETRRENKTHTEEEVIARFKQVHGGKYDYSKVKYISSTTEVIIICPDHGEFTQLPVTHNAGHKCSDCTATGFKSNLPAILYYLEVDGGTAYKIGITNNTIEQRFSSSDLSKIKVLNVVEYAHGGDAYKAEQKILKEFAYAKYTGDDLLTSGNTELFNQDVLLKG